MPERPWAARARELEAVEGPYCDYIAWEQFFSREVDGLLPKGVDPILDTLDAIQKAYLYNRMFHLAEPEEESLPQPDATVEAP